MADNATLREVYSFSSNDTTSSHADDHDKVVNQPNTALLSMILCFGTFFIAYSLRSFKTSKFLGKHVRCEYKSLDFLYVLFLCRPVTLLAISPFQLPSSSW